jgi:putative membrane protein
MLSSRYIAVFFKGMAMGAADVVPGVSGGTIAFISGIYEELINTLKSMNPKALMLLFKEGPTAFWQAINGTFITSLLLGIVCSFLSLAHAITYVMQHHPIPLWAFFFGLVLASSFLLAKQINYRCPVSLLALAVGIVLAVWTTLATPIQSEPSTLFIFIAGAIAICAMILPGISGSFILLLLGMYAFILEAVKGLDIVVVAVFIAGCATGLLSFVHLLSRLLKRYHSITLALLTGFLLGSLNALWPWKQVLVFYESRKGLKPLLQENVLPSQFQTINSQDPQLLLAIAALFIGLAVVLVLERVSSDSSI